MGGETGGCTVVRRLKRTEMRMVVRWMCGTTSDDRTGGIRISNEEVRNLINL